VTCVALKEGFSGTRIAPSLNQAYVRSAFSMVLPSDTATRSPFRTPCSARPWASAVEREWSSSYVKRVAWCLDITASESPYWEAIWAR